MRRVGQAAARYLSAVGEGITRSRLSSIPAGSGWFVGAHAAVAPAAVASRTLATKANDPLAGFVATQEAVEALLSGWARHRVQRIGEVVNPGFEGAEQCVDDMSAEEPASASETDSYSGTELGAGADGVASAGWLQYQKSLDARAEALHGWDLIDAWWLLSCRALFAGTANVPALQTSVLVVTDRDGKRHDFPLDKPLDVPALLAHCSPSPFGDLKTMTTRIDPAVRTAMELKHKDIAGPGEAYFELECRGKEKGNEAEPVPLRDAVTHTASWLAAGVPDRKAKAVPQKLNIYGPGGHFKRHVDTPVGDRPAMLGTALVALPSEFKGGELVVEAPGSSAAAGTKADDSAARSNVTWAPTNLYENRMLAFYGDCPHEVKRVTTGHRVTLSFAVFAEGGCASESVACAAVVGPQAARDAAINAAAAAFVACVNTSLAARKPFGLMLTHGYTLSSLDERKPHLKGADATAWSALRAADLGGAIVHLRPVVYRRYERRQPAGDDDDDDEQYSLSSSVFSFTPDDMKALRDGKPMPKPTIKTPTDAAGSASAPDASAAGNTSAGKRRSLPLKNVSFFTLDTPKVRVHNMQQEAAEWTGNSAEDGIDDQTYFSGAIIILPASTS